MLRVANVVDDDGLIPVYLRVSHVGLPVQAHARQCTETLQLNFLNGLVTLDTFRLWLDAANIVQRHGYRPF